MLKPGLNNIKLSKKKKAAEFFLLARRFFFFTGPESVIQAVPW